MCTDRDPPPCEHGELIAEVDRLQGHNASLTATVKELRRQLAAAQRSGKRQAAPFSKGRRIDKPRRPGRKPGMGNFSYRKPPSADELSGPPVDVSVADDNCPGCGGVLEQQGVDVAYVTDIPAMPRPQVTEYRVQVCRCRGCGRRVRGRHAEVGADQYGASAHRVGRRVMAAAHVLHYGVGVPVRRVPSVLRALTGVELNQGAITQDALRRARGAVGDAYQRLRDSVRASRIVHTDDTGWRVCGEGAFLMALETDEATVYQVRARHRNEEVREVVPSEYGGVMVTDRGRSYDAQALSGVKQQKCLAHVLRSISEVVQTKRGRGRSFGKHLSGLLREAMELRQSYRRGEASDYVAETERLRREVSYHLRDRPMPALDSDRGADRDNGRLQNELGWHDDRGNLLRFLDDPGIEPTNNRAERALRGDSAQGVALLEERRWCGCVQCVHQCNQDAGPQRWRSAAGGWSVRCVQRRACPRPLHLNLFPTSTPPLINYNDTKAAAESMSGLSQNLPGSNSPSRLNQTRIRSSTLFTLLDSPSFL